MKIPEIVQGLCKKANFAYSHHYFQEYALDYLATDYAKEVVTTSPIVLMIYPVKYGRPSIAVCKNLDVIVSPLEYPLTKITRELRKTVCKMIKDKYVFDKSEVIERKLRRWLKSIKADQIFIKELK
jgi:hypothetical protein